MVDIRVTVIEGDTTRKLTTGPDSDPNDPDKIWVILHFPDTLVRVKRSDLCTLLKNLRAGGSKECFDPKLRDLCDRMKSIEWTLTSRINCTDDKSSQQSIQCCGEACAAETKEEQSSSNKDVAAMKVLPALSTSPAGYFSMTAPVCSSSNDHDPHCPSEHYVVEYTDTVIADLRFKFKNPCCKVEVPNEKSRNISVFLADAIADKVRDIVTEWLQDILKNQDPSSAKKYVVYVLKPQCQTAHGISRSNSKSSICPEDLLPFEHEDEPGTSKKAKLGEE